MEQTKIAFTQAKKLLERAPEMLINESYKLLELVSDKDKMLFLKLIELAAQKVNISFLKCASIKLKNKNQYISNILEKEIGRRLFKF